MRKYLKVSFTLCVALLLVAAFTALDLSAKERPTSNIKAMLSQSAQNVAFDQYDSNNIVSWVSTNGQYTSHIPTGGNSGLEFPKGSNNTAVFAGGLWMVGKVGEDIRSAAAEFSTEFVAGPFGGNSAAQHIFRVHPDFPNGLDVNGDGDFDDSFDNLRDEGFQSANGEFDPWSAWPAQNGAPVNDDGTPEILGSSTLWMVFNDGNASTHGNLWATEPMGVEVQATMFGFNRSDPTGNIMFIKWLILNKGGNQIDSAFVSIWHDDDVGTAGDDLVGVDTTLSLGYTYNGGAIDGVYGATPPAVGSDFFQGPLVPDPDGVGFAFGEPQPGFRNLPVTSFAKYINGGPVEFEDPETAPEAFNYMKGLTKLGAPLIDATTNLPTRFAHAGDPVTGSGWLDTNPGDRRYLLTSGPFDMAPGEVQEVVGSIIIAQGTNNLNAVSALRFFDIFAQTAFDNNFDLPVAQPPDFDLTGLDQSVVITWEDSKEGVETVDQGGYTFEGYNVYQGQSITGPWTRLATFDLNNDRTIILDAEFDVETATISEVPVAFGDNTGIQRFLTVDADALRGNANLINYRPYYFAVTSYIVNVGVAPRVIESPIQGKSVFPVKPDLGETLASDSEETITASQTSGSATADVTAIIVDPELVTGDSYRVTFPADNLLTLTNVDNGNVVAESVPADVGGGLSNVVVDGITLQISAAAGFAAPATYDDEIFVTDADPSDNGLDLWFDGTAFGPTGDVAAVSGGQFARGATEFLQLDIEMRFTGVPSDQSSLAASIDSPIESGGQWGTYYEQNVATGGTSLPADPSDRLWNPVRVAFELWDVENDRQVNVIILNRNSDGAAPYGATAGDPNTPGMEPRWRISGRDYIIPFMTDYDEAFAMSNRLGWDGTDAETGRPNTDFATWFLFFHQGGVDGGDTWTTGDVFALTYANPIIPGIDEFEFDTPNNVRGDQVAAEQQAADLVNVFPNPYLGSNLDETDAINRFLTFTHLPTDGPTTIRIFTVAGNVVRVLEHDGSSQFMQWDLRNQSDLPVASGIYLAVMDFESLGTQKVLKVAVMQPDERLQIF